MEGKEEGAPVGTADGAWLIDGTEEGCGDKEGVPVGHLVGDADGFCATTNDSDPVSSRT